MMKRGYFIGLAVGCAVLMLGCTNREKDQANDPDAPAVTDSTGLTEGDADVAEQDVNQTGASTDPNGNSGGGTAGQTADVTGQTADVTGQTAVSAGKNTDSSGESTDNNGQQTDSGGQTQEIGMDAAKKIALTKAGLTGQDGSWKEEKRDQEDGRIVYELEFVSDNVEYDFEIDAQQGTILEYQEDPIND